MRSRTLAVMLALASVANPGTASAASRMFSSGSLIIPASIEYQTDSGVLSTYGLTYVLLWKNAQRVAQGLKPITLYWIVEPTKLSQYRCYTGASSTWNGLPQYSPSYNDNDGCDFAVQNADGQPVALLDASGNEVAPFQLVDNVGYKSGTGPLRNSANPRPDSRESATPRWINSTTKAVKYLGGAWVVDALDRQAFITMLSSVTELAPFHKNGVTSANWVNIHSARANFTATVASILTAKPPLIAYVGTTGQTDFLKEVLDNAGICPALALSASNPPCTAEFSASGFTSGIVFDHYANVSDLMSAAGSYPDGRLNGVVNGNTYGLLWAGVQAWPNGTYGNPSVAAADHLANLQKFLDAGRNVFAEYDSIQAIENRTPLQTSTGAQQYTSNVSSWEDCNDDLVASSSFFYGGTAGNCLTQGGANQPYAQTGNFLYDGGQGDFKAYVATSSFKPGVTQVLRVGTTGSGPTVSSGWYYQNDPSKGLLLYLAGHKFDNSRLWGERLILNTIFAKLNTGTIELSRSEPVGYTNTAVSPATNRVYQGTYVQQPLPDSNDVVTYNPAAAQIWQFPYTRGHLYEYALGSIASTSQAFSANSRWDAAARLPLPGDRNIFTVVGGSAHLGWTKIPVNSTQTGSSCTDTNGNGKCDLSELLAACNAAGVTTNALLAKSATGFGDQAAKLGMLVQQVRGYCSAHDPKITGTPILQPADSDCDDLTKQNNRAKLGGIDHSTPAVVGASRYITTPSQLASRPIVAYAAGWDGMLHAFFVSGSDGSSTSWSFEGQSLPTGVQSGQELWAFLPPAQVCGLATNNAVVDGSINVVDVFGDFPYDADNNGVIAWTNADERPNHVYRWRTVLTATSGAGGSEMFALDVTNPLKPILLWHLAAPIEHDGKWWNASTGNWSGTFDSTDSTTYAIKWFDWDDNDGSTSHIPTDYNTTDASVLSNIKFGKYDYRNLGLAYSTAIAKRWAGNSFQYMLLVATNAVDYTNTASPTGYRGAEVFAVDLVTGQKLWQWEHLHNSGDGAGIDNSVPPRIALGDLDANGSTERIYVGDLEGHLWELAAADGRNINYLPDSGSPATYRSFPLFGTPAMTGTAGGGASDETKNLFKVNGTTPLAQQPITTPIGQGRFTAVPTALQSYLLNRLAMVIGTMGVDWAIAPYEAGNLYVVPVSPSAGTRLQPPIDVNATPNPLLYGVLLPAAAWTIPLDTGERVYSTPRIVNNTILFNTSFGSFGGDISSSISDLGYLKIVTGDTTGTHVDARANDSKSFAGVLIIGGSVVVTTDTSIRVLSSPPSSLSGDGIAQQPFNRATPAFLQTWEVIAP